MHSTILSGRLNERHPRPRARRFLVTGSLQIKPSGSVDENGRILGTYMRRMRNNNLKIMMAGSS